MGMISIWDGEQLPPVGCEVLIELASHDEPYQMKVTGYWLKPTDEPHKFIVCIELVDAAGATNQRWLSEVHPLTWRKA